MPGNFLHSTSISSDLSSYIVSAMLTIRTVDSRTTKALSCCKLFSLLLPFEDVVIKDLEVG